MATSTLCTQLSLEWGRANIVLLVLSRINGCFEPFVNGCSRAFSAKADKSDVPIHESNSRSAPEATYDKNSYDKEIWKNISGNSHGTAH